MIATLKFLIIAAAIGYVAIVAVMYFSQRKLQYFPDNKQLTPAMLGLTGIEITQLETPDGEHIAAWYSPARAGQPTILFFHGNGGELADRSVRFAAYQAEGMGALFVSYRGYGGSTGTPSERGLILDAMTAYDWLTNRKIESRDIVVVGESLGSGVAVQLATRRKVAALAVEAPFASAADIAARVYWWLPARWLMKDQFNSLSYIGRIDVPLLVIHGDLDEIIPVAEGKRLFAAASEPKEIVIINGGTHTSIFGEESWTREIEFFKRVHGNHQPDGGGDTSSR